MGRPGAPRVPRDGFAHVGCGHGPSDGPRRRPGASRSRRPWNLRVHESGRILFRDGRRLAVPPLRVGRRPDVDRRHRGRDPGSDIRRQGVHGARRRRGHRGARLLSFPVNRRKQRPHRGQRASRAQWGGAIRSRSRRPRGDVRRFRRPDDDPVQPPQSGRPGVDPRGAARARRPRRKTRRHRPLGRDPRRSDLSGHPHDAVLLPAGNVESNGDIHVAVEVLQPRRAPTRQHRRPRPEATAGFHPRVKRRGLQRTERPRPRRMPRRLRRGRGMARRLPGAHGRKPGVSGGGARGNRRDRARRTRGHIPSLA